MYTRFGVTSKEFYKEHGHPRSRAFDTPHAQLTQFRRVHTALDRLAYTFETDPPFWALGTASSTPIGR